jgi:GntR family transcriptional repressor for pyruvate dehydrogenase complex
MPSEKHIPEPSALFNTVQRRTTLADRVTRQMEQLIIEGRLRPGDRLPPERELARQFGVSRTVVREAMRALIAKSLLEVRPGSGTVVCSPTAEAVAQSMALFLRAGQAELDYEKILEIRRLLEVEIAGLAAERHTSEDVEEMEQVLREAAEIHGDRDSFAQYDVDFHATLARATHNELFSLVLDSMLDIMIKVRQVAFDVPGMRARSLKRHRAIVEQVKMGDPHGARQAMREHLVESEETMRKALALHASQSQSVS